MSEIVEKIRRLLFHRQSAYLHTFNVKDKNAEIVLMDLAKFCRAHKTTFFTDQRAHALAEGRREVWLRIQNHIQLDSATLWKLHEANEPKQQ